MLLPPPPPHAAIHKHANVAAQIGAFLPTFFMTAFSVSAIWARYSGCALNETPYCTTTVSDALDFIEPAVAVTVMVDVVG